MVAPSSIAASKSSLMPIDNSRNSRDVARSRSAANQPRRSPDLGRHGHQPHHLEVEAPGGRRPAPRSPAGAHPPLRGSASRFTSTSTRAPGARRAIASPSARRSTECQQLTHGTSPPPCSAAADRRSATSAPTRVRRERRRLGEELLGPVLPQVGQAGVERLREPVGRHRLRRPDQARRRPGPARRGPRRRPPARARRTALRRRSSLPLATRVPAALTAA